MSKGLHPADAKHLVHGAGELAFLDVREYGQYGEGHPLLATSAPYGRLEAVVPALVPNRFVQILLLDDGDGVAERAAARLEGLGYTQISIVKGGAPAWAAAGFALYKGVNVPSKTLGELVETIWHPKTIDARTLRAWQAEGRPHVLFDTRPPNEYRKMTVPGARSGPNGELLHRLSVAVPEKNDPIVLTCAGRTRGLIGAIGLKAAGVSNPVYALENGTQGWALAGFDLARGCQPASLPDPGTEAANESRSRAERIRTRTAIPFINAERFNDLVGDPSRTLTLLDVRSAEEYANGHLPGALHAPCVQLVQATDEWVGVRRSRLVLTDDTGLRAVLAAFWLQQLGYEVYVMRKDDANDLDERWLELRPLPRPVECPPLRRVTPKEAELLMREGRARLIDIRPSMAYRQAHPERAVWSIRPRLGRVAGDNRTVLLIADDAATAEFAAADLSDLGIADIGLVEGGIGGWREAGLPLEASPHQPADEDAIDFLFFVHDRHDGNLDAARRYLEWETGLVRQHDAAERAEFLLAEPF
jgi:rhodanese-related sulfurtransferase